jgi:hypothetical protein
MCLPRTLRDETLCPTTDERPLGRLLHDPGIAHTLPDNPPDIAIPTLQARARGGPPPTEPNHRSEALFSEQALARSRQ